MKWFDKWFMKMSRKAWNNSRGTSQSDGLVNSTRSSSYSGLRGGQPISFTIFKANGGFVIQYYSEDHNNAYNSNVATGNHEPKLLIVNNGEELGKAIDQLILVEALKA